MVFFTKELSIREASLDVGLSMPAWGMAHDEPYLVQFNGKAGMNPNRCVSILEGFDETRVFIALPPNNDFISHEWSVSEPTKVVYFGKFENVNNVYETVLLVEVSGPCIITWVECVYHGRRARDWHREKRVLMYNGKRLLLTSEDRAEEKASELSLQFNGAAGMFDLPSRDIPGAAFFFVFHSHFCTFLTHISLKIKFRIFCLITMM